MNPVENIPNQKKNKKKFLLKRSKKINNKRRKEHKPQRNIVDDIPISESIEFAFKHPESLLPHLNALRVHLFRSVLVFIGICIAAFFFIDTILNWISAPVPGGLEALEAVDVTEPLSVVMRVLLYTGLTISIPYFLFEIFLFVAPALSIKTKFLWFLSIPVLTLFFLTGMVFAYYILLPPAINFLLTYFPIQTQPRPETYLTLISSIMFWMGLAFEMPPVAFVLARVGLIQAEWLTKYWRIAVVVIAVLAAIITPTPDPLNMLLAMSPLVGIYYLSILLAIIGQQTRTGKRNDS
ncbi:MAG: twin-arginine translocase subunit TatC [Anaerolineales bacterium]|nr:twin-arginine translocase subunit TatC [Anaerolineales bacterium]